MNRKSAGLLSGPEPLRAWSSGAARSRFFLLLGLLLLAAGCAGSPAAASSNSATTTPVLQTQAIAQLLNAPHPDTSAAAAASAISAAFAADPSVPLSGNSNKLVLTEAQFTGAPANPSAMPSPGSSGACSASAKSCGYGFSYACAQDGAPWQGGSPDIRREKVCENEILLLFLAYRATGHDAFYEASLSLYNYSIGALPDRAASIKAYLMTSLR